MRNYIILNGVNSNTIKGLLISTLPPITKSKIRTQKEEIDGRDGDIVTKLGYSAYDKEFTIGLYGDFDINEVISYFNSEGTVVFSNEDDKYYNYQILEQIDFEKLIRFKTAKVRMHVQPFKYPTEEEQIQVDATVITEEGTDLTLEYTSVDEAITTEIKGNTYQYSTTGKNLFNKNATPKITNQVDVTPINTGIRLTQINTGSYKYAIYVLFDISNYIGQKFTLSGTAIPSGNNTARINIMLCDSNGENRTTLKTITGNNINETATIPTPSGSSYYLGLTIYSTGDYSASPGDYIDYINFQLESGSTATDYEPYTNGASPNPDYPQEVEVVTGDNEIVVSNKNLFYGARQNVYFNSSYVFAEGITGASTTNFIPAKEGDIFTISTATASNGIVIASFDENYNCLARNATGTSLTITHTCPIGTKYIIGSNYVGMTINTQLEKGSTATEFIEHQEQDYPISLGSMELCKIGDYQDYLYKNNGNWYKHSVIGKVVLDGTTEGNYWFKSSTQQLDRFGIALTRLNISLGASGGISSNFIVKTTLNSTYPSLYLATDNTNLYVDYGAYSSMTASDFTTWLSTHNTTVYYVLATPTDTQITDETLLGQLEALAGATTYDTTTNIIVTSDNLLPTLNVKTQGMPNTIVENIGNIYAKPLLTIYGSGDIGVYLNKIQVLQIALGDNGSITIDVSKMEAYNATTQALLNRLVTGDYMNVLINSGENEIAFSGNVLGFTMDNYTRWL